MKISDSLLEIVSLGLIIIGILLCFLFVLDNNPADAFFLVEDDQNAYLKGTVVKTSYNSNTDSTYLKISSCRIFNSYYNGDVSSLQGDVLIKGTYFEGAFNIEHIEQIGRNENVTSSN
jgi:hypothetical protein